MKQELPMPGVFMKMLKQGARPQGRSLLAATVLAAAALLASCGGGGQIEDFQPKRIMAFGDESSLITSEGRKYTVNALNSTTKALDCASNPIWVQSLASTFGLVFVECNSDSVVAPTGQIYAQAGAKVAELKIQLDTFFATGGFNSKDLVTVMAGANDVLEIYAQYPQQGLDTLKALAGQRGRDLATQVNRIANADGRVIVVTLPDLGLTPYALAERDSKPDTNRSELLTELVTAFNTEMRLNIINDGRLIGLVLGDEMVQSIVKYPSSYGYANVTEAVCLSTVVLPGCTSSTLVTDGSASTWLWADSTRLSPAGHSRLGTLAISRATNNPF
jgi:outer membrane lipase/esterase